jgi:hypothetical protein
VRAEQGRDRYYQENFLSMALLNRFKTSRLGGAPA